MIKVNKRAPRGWLGKDLGYDCAAWAVVADPSITVSLILAKAGYDWIAVKDGHRIARGCDMETVLRSLAEKRPELVKAKARKG